MSIALTILQVVTIGGLLVAGFWYGNKQLVSYFENRPHLKFRRQLIQLGGSLIAVLLIILLMPIGDILRGQLLSLFGLIVSATIALSSTTLVGNVMAGIMLKTIGSCKPGSFITVGDHFGRVSAMDLLHTEIQTEERDLTTLPNMYLVAHPVRVMHDAGSVLSVELSLGYDVSRHVVEKLLIKAAEETALENPANPDTGQPETLEGQRRKLLAQALLNGRIQIEIYGEEGVLIDLVPLDLGAFDGTREVKLETRPLRLDSPPARVSFAP